MCASVTVQEIRCFGYRRVGEGGELPASFAPLTSSLLFVPPLPPPPSDLLRGVAMIVTAFMPFRFSAQTPIFSISPSSFNLSPM